MRNKNQRGAEALCRADERRRHFLCPLSVKTRRRFVGEDHFRCGEEDARKRRSLHFSPREMLGARTKAHAVVLEKLPGPFSVVRGRPPIEGCRKKHVLLGRKILEEPEVLKEKSAVLSPPAVPIAFRQQG